MAKLRTKAKQDQRIEYQAACVRAILEGTNLGTHCFLTRVKDEQPYDNLALPVNLGELEFTLKGALRCEMIDHDETSYARWRRLFGTTKRQQFPKRVEGGEDLPKSWRSRVYVRAFEDTDSARQALDQCPLIQWEGLTACPLTAKSTEASRSRIVLLQIHDVEIEDETFAELFARFLESKSQILSLIDRQSCPGPFKLGQAKGTTESIVIPQFRWEGPGLLHTGYSSTFAKYAKDVGGRKVSVNLETRSREGELTPSFLASSVKGVFRGASAWLVERLARDLGNTHGFVTCDYGGLDAEGGYTEGCPVCRVYGGSVCRVGDHYRERGRVSFSFEDADNAIHPSVTRRGHYFAHELTKPEAKRGQQLMIQSIESTGTSLSARIEPADDLSVSLVCLAADLVAAGLFRFGRFTTRGYGLARLVPIGYQHSGGDLYALLESGGLSRGEAPEGYGLSLARQILGGVSPLDVVAREVRQYIP